MESWIGVTKLDKIEGIVNITKKPVVERRAVATGVINLSTGSKQAIENRRVSKGDVIEASTIAAIQAVKDTPRIVPHCHPIPLEGCEVSWGWENLALRCTVKVVANYKTGIEMEAITGVVGGLLCVLDMVKYLEKDENGQYKNTSITGLKILEKYKSN
tara:strand:- start:2718 stop:3191 length:474 start_codon:yes stop_codon:yes gene_type:complete